MPMSVPTFIMYVPVMFISSHDVRSIVTHHMTLLKVTTRDL